MLAIHTKKELLSEIRRTLHHVASLQKAIEYYNDHPLYQNGYVDLLKRITNKSLLQQCLLLTARFGTFARHQIRRRIYCVQFYRECFPPSLMPLQTEIAQHAMCMIDVGLNPYLFRHAGRAAILALFNWNPFVRTGSYLPKWITDAMYTAMLCFKCICPMLPLAVQKSIMLIMVRATITDMYYNATDPNQRCTKRIKLIKPVYNAECKQDWEAEAEVAWSISNTKFFLDYLGITKQCEFWSDFINEVIANTDYLLRLCALMKYRFITPNVIASAYRVRGEDSVLCALVKSSRIQRSWNSMLQTPIPYTVEVAQSGYYWQIAGESPWKSAWFSWSIRNHQNMLLYTTRFRAQADIILQHLPPCFSRICYHLARYYFYVNRYRRDQETTADAKVIELNSTLLPCLRNKIPAVGHEHFHLIAHRLIATDKLLRHGSR